ncbi:hypothetical protein KKC88_06340 [Patescibacteria group bacterium]|nr:hypothetical protein [Patescibacteria group bacterium]MBU1673899.1 hypothetical protein [Patescibacteria group bacterium]MBU1963428.1 hypothetical protein [Patescibacteria group bacterium]
MKWIDNILQSGIELKRTDINYSRIRFFHIVAFLGIIIFTYYVIVNLQIKDYYPAFLEITFIILLLTALIILRVTKKMEISFQIGAFVITAMSIHNFGTGGFFATGNLWIYLYPPAIFLLMGYRKGVYWTLALFAFMITAAILQSIRVIDMPYIPYETWLTVISMAIISLVVLIYARGQEARSRLIESQAGDIRHATSDLEKANIELKKEAKQREIVMQELEAKKEQSDKMNKLMVGREKKIIELKEEIKNLESK